MKANERVLEQILHSGDQYVIPLFQRYYKWTRDNWARLWNDIYDLVDEEGKRHHFLGSVVCVADNHQPGMVPRYLVIDGQQRIVTLSILLCALRGAAAAGGRVDLAAEIEDNFLLHRHKKKLDRYKVVPRQRDRQSYLDLLDRKPSSEKTNITEAYDYFSEKLAEAGNENGRVEELFKIVSNGVMLVMITLDAGENPFAIASRKGEESFGRYKAVSALSPSSARELSAESVDIENPCSLEWSKHRVVTRRALSGHRVCHGKSIRALCSSASAKGTSISE